MNKLLKKLLRDVKKSLGQFIAVTLVSAIGIMLLTGMAVVHSTLRNTTDGYYKDSNLADLSAYYLGIDNQGLDKIKEINGVSDVYGRLMLKGVNTKDQSGFIVHTVSKDEKISIPTLKAGQLPKTKDECIIDYDYALKNNISVGDKVSVNINEKTYDFTVSGTFISSEYIYLVDDPTKNLIPDHKVFGLLYVDKSLVPNLSKNNTYNEVLVSLKSGADPSSVKKEIEEKTGTYGFGNITLKKDQLSYQQLESDIVTSDSVAKIFPYIFFLVAAVILFISMSRTVQSERGQIGIMKALGISNRSVTFHYLSYSILCGILGSLIGNLVGIMLVPRLMLDSYKMIYTLPDMQYSGFWWYVVVSTIIVVLFGITASLFSARKVLQEVPASCMRPVPPKKVHKTWLEKRKRLWRKISYKNKLIIRNIFLNKRRVILSSVGVIGCVGVLMCALGLQEATNSIIIRQFDEIQRFDDMVLFSKPLTYSDPVPFDSKNIEQGDKYSAIPVTVPLKKDVNVQLNVLPKDNKSIQLYDNSNRELNLPDNGVVVSYKLSQDNNIKVGDELLLRLQSPLYNNQTVKAKVAAIDVLYISQDIYAAYDYVQKLGVTPYVTGYYLTAKDKTQLKNMNKDLSSLPNVRSVVENKKLKEDITSTMGIMNTVVFLMIIMSAALALAVIFNISSINIFERRRDIATLKVLGYHKKEINSLVHVENFMITAFGSVLGILFGAVIYKFILGSVVSDSMYFPYYISFKTIAVSVILTFVFTAFANFMLRGKTKRIDMVESLKSVE